MTKIGSTIVAAGVTLLALAASPLAAASAAATDAVGTWLTENGHGVIRIEPCTEGLCGTIVGIDRAPGEAMPIDHAGRPQCGLNIISGTPDATGGVVEGHVTDPRDGKTYQAQIWVDDAGRLHLRGYLGIPLLGATQVWRPFSGHLADDCRIT
jgi:uncharacterized protein (DUF2147 family)